MTHEMPPISATLIDAVSDADARLGIAAAFVEPASADAPSEPADVARYVLFTIGSTVYAVPEALVTELDRIPRITTVPNVPAWVRGVANLRGDVISVIDLRAFLDLDATSSSRGRIVVVRLLDQRFSTALVVDEVEQIAALPDADIRPPAAPLEGALAAFLRGVCVVGDRPVAVLDLDRFLRSPDIRQFDEATEDSSCKAR